MSELKSRRGGMALAVMLALACVLATSVSSIGSLSDDANALRLAELENQLSEPTSLVEMTSTQLVEMDTAAVIAAHVQETHQAEAMATADDDSAFKAMSEQDQRAEVDASLAEVEAAEAEGRSVTGSALLQTSSQAMSSSDYWDNAWHRRWWCNNVRWGYWWIERHPHWQRVCSKIEQFRPWGWWSYMCHNMYSGHWGRWYRNNWWWKHHCDSIRNPNYVGTKGGKWRWHPKHQRHGQSDWCEQNGHLYRDLNNAHYNHYCHGREAPKGYVRGLWDVDTKSDKVQQANFWFCRQYRSFDASWKTSNNMEAYRSRCYEGEGARGAKHPGFDPNMTPAQRAEVIAKAKRAAERAAAEAAKPRWVWSRKVPRTRDSDWCEANGLTQSESSRYQQSCDGNRESEAARIKRIARAKRKAEKRVLARIPVAKPAGSVKPVKQIPLKPFSKSPLVQQARRAAALKRAEAKLTPRQRRRRARKLAKERAAAKAALPAGIKGANMAQMMNALKVAATAPAPKKRTAAAGKATVKPMPPPPAMPKKPASAPKLSQLKKVARAVAAVAAAKTAPVKTADVKAAAAVAALVAPAAAKPAAKKTEAEEEEDKAKAAKAAGAPAAEPADPADPAEAVPAAAAAAARAAPARQETIEERWDREDNERRRARRERLRAEDKADEAEAARRARRAARGRLATERGEGGRDGVNAGENIDWNFKFPSPGPYSGKRAAASDVRRGAEGKKGCPNCKLRHIRKKWSIVLDPTSVNAIDLPLLEELHRRVDYLVEPQAKRLAVAQNILRSARAQVVDAAEHHERIQDFGIKHKNQLLVPQYIQDEAKIVELD